MANLVSEAQEAYRHLRAEGLDPEVCIRRVAAAGGLPLPMAQWACATDPSTPFDTCPGAASIESLRVRYLRCPEHDGRTTVDDCGACEGLGWMPYMDCPYCDGPTTRLYNRCRACRGEGRLMGAVYYAHVVGGWTEIVAHERRALGLDAITTDRCGVGEIRIPKPISP